MNWYYVLDGQRCGPISEAQLDQLLRSGTIDENTLVWREGLTNWCPLRTARSGATSAPPSGVCSECGRSFSQLDMVLLNQSWICAECKPVFLQRLKEGAAPATTRGLVWRFNRQMVMRPETPLPDRCVRCNAPANGFRLKRQLYWHPPAYYLLIIASLVIYVIVAVIVRKKALIHVGLCEQHRRQRRWIIAGSWLAVLVGVAMLISGISGSRDVLSFIGVALVLGGAIFGAVRGPVVSAAKIDRDFVWVKGPGKEFLAGFPEWSGRP